MKKEKYLNESEKNSKRYQGEYCKPRAVEKNDDGDQDIGCGAERGGK